jgi:hypothetical protein
MNAFRRPFEIVRAWILLLVFRFSIRREVHGIQLVVPSANDQAPAFFEKTKQALELIRKADPRRWAKIPQLLPRIVLILGGGEFYHRDLHAYIVDLPSLRARSALELASAIVHESTHARINRFGAFYSPALRPRVEALCISQEIAFLRRFPESGALVTSKQESLKNPWWSDESLNQRRLAHLRAAGIPEFLVRVFDRLRRLTRAS